jgi:hypothetical protein
MTEENGSSGSKEIAATIPSGELPDSIQKLLQERQKIDAQLKEKFTRQITVLFTDIKNSTSFFASRGDIEGRVMLQKHNALLFPIIEKYHGWVVKTIGDAIMAGPTQVWQCVQPVRCSKPCLNIIKLSDQVSRFTFASASIPDCVLSRTGTFLVT